MTLPELERRLQAHFEQVRRDRPEGKPIFALEHGLEPGELRELATAICAHVATKAPSIEHSLPWIVYAAELGYRYAGDEYWQTFEEETPGWVVHGKRQWLRERFQWFHQRFQGAKPAGPWAVHFSIICWPITHAILPRDLQRQLAKVLFQLRHAFSAELFASPAKLGELIAARSWEGTSRFQNLAQETLLIGQIAAALLLEGEQGTAGLLLPSTLRRIGTDLDRERTAREWLRGARSLAQERARFHGLSVPRTLGAVSPQRAREVVAALGIEPRLLLRPKDVGGTSWDVFLEVPDLQHLLLRFPETRAALVESRCTVAGTTGRPLARGRLLHGTQQVALNRWPAPEEALLQFERTPPQLEYLLRTECLLRPGPTWLFRVASDGLAYELRGRQVRPGQSYVLVTTAGPFQVRMPARTVNLSCEGADGALIELPPALTASDATLLESLGLGMSKSVQVSPAGLAAAAWDGEGRGEWLATEKPCISIRADHALDSVLAALGAGGTPIDLGSTLPGEPLFLELPSLPVGIHTLHVRVQEHGSGKEPLLGELELAIRDPRPWTLEPSRQGPLVVQVEPAAPTLEQLWEGRLELELLGPPDRAVHCTASLFERSKEEASISRQLPPLDLPVSAARWRAHFDRHFCQGREAANAYDTARACELVFAAEELGVFRLQCERHFTPLRWGVRNDTQGQLLALLDDSGQATTAAVSLYRFDLPDREERLDPALLVRPMRVPVNGGMYVARHNTLDAAVITPPCAAWEK